MVRAVNLEAFMAGGTWVKSKGVKRQKSFLTACGSAHSADVQLQQ